MKRLLMPNSSSRHRTLLALALPMILANISQPILGLVDTAVLGHLGAPEYLAGTAVGAFLLSQLYWLCGFLRQSMTGLSAQAKGAKVNTGQLDDLARAMFFALGLGTVLIISHPLLITLILSVTELPALAGQSLDTYLSIRVFNAPIALFNLITIGYLVGQQHTRYVMWLQVGVNLLNIALNFVFVYGLSLGVAGVAYATVIAEWTMFLLSLFLIVRATTVGARLSQNWWRWVRFARILKLNRDLFLRALMLQACLAFLTFQGARYGVTEAAVNAILMQFFILTALALDGIAYAIEAMIGEQEGARRQAKVHNGLWRDIRVSLIWSNVFGFGLMIIVALGYAQFVELLTNQVRVREAAAPYYHVMVALPWVAHWCYCLDGIYIGLIRGDIMRNSMVVSALVGFFGIFWLTQTAQNMALWYALLGLQVMRGLTLGGHLFMSFRQHN